MATILGNPRRKGQRKFSKARKAKGKKHHVSRVGAWTGASKKHSRAAKKGWKHKRVMSGVGIATVANVRKGKRVSKYKRHKSRLGQDVTSIQTAFVPSSNILTSTLYGAGGFVVAKKGGDFLRNMFSGVFGGGIGTGLGEPLFAYASTAISTILVNKLLLGSGKETDSYYTGGLLYTFFSLFRQFFGGRSPLGQYDLDEEHELLGQDDDAEYELLGEGDDEDELGEYESLTSVGAYEPLQLGDFEPLEERRFV